MKNLMFYCIVIAMSISSCTQDKTDDSILTKNENIRHYDLSEKEALNIVSSFETAVVENAKTRGVKNTFSIKRKYLLNSNEKKTRTSHDGIDPLIYEIEMNDGVKKGKAIVSGDKRFPEVLAYIPSCNDSVHEISLESQAMIQMAQNTLLDKIYSYETEAITRSYDGPIHGELYVHILPFCTTEWGEGFPFNELLPQAWVEYIPGISGGRPGSSLYKKYNTGKAVTAIAQVMAWFTPYLKIDETTIDWEALTTESKITDEYRGMAAKLCKYIYDSTGTYPVWGKSYNDSWPAGIVTAVIDMECPIGNIRKTLESKCGLTSTYEQKWNLEVIKKSLTDISPVIVGDDSNRLAFIIDGYAVSEDNSNENVYLHCNFCRSGNFDGYYLVYKDGRVVFNLNGYLYRDIYLTVISNIKKKRREI